MRDVRPLAVPPSQLDLFGGAGLPALLAPVRALPVPPARRSGAAANDNRIRGRASDGRPAGRDRAALLITFEAEPFEAGRRLGWFRIDWVGSARQAKIAALWLGGRLKAVPARADYLESADLARVQKWVDSHRFDILMSVPVGTPFIRLASRFAGAPGAVLAIGFFLHLGATVTAGLQFDGASVSVSGLDPRLPKRAEVKARFLAWGEGYRERTLGKAVPHRDNAS